VRKFGVVVGAVVLLLGAFVAARVGWYYLSYYRTEPPTLDLKPIRGGDLGKPIVEEADRARSPVAVLDTSVQPPDHFVISGYVEPRHNHSSKLSVDIVCANRRDYVQVRETFFERVSNGRGGWSITLDVRANHAIGCSVSARSSPYSFGGTLTPNDAAVARVALYCPTDCVRTPAG
jgi:hypothetical protein